MSYGSVFNPHIALAKGPRQKMIPNRQAALFLNLYQNFCRSVLISIILYCNAENINSSSPSEKKTRKKFFMNGIFL